jgi:NAD(P)-dependent dehydrogenase (short-subunit alcohol dehydrogenase family)
MPFQNQSAIVTGGASGIGKALCEELAARGAVVVVADIRLAGAESVAAAITALGGRASAAQVDVRQAAEVQALVENVVQGHGRLDFIFNNAGIGVGGEIRELTLEHWRTAVDINLMGVIHGVMAAYPVMLHQGAGHIVNIASLAGLVPAPGFGPYAATKAAVVSLTSVLRAEAESFGIRASVACPGFVKTAIFEHAIGMRVDKEELVSKIGMPFIPAENAARRILRGVERNQAVIVFPLNARIVWRLMRFCPWLLAPFQRVIRARLRSVRRVT